MGVLSRKVAIVTGSGRGITMTDGVAPKSGDRWSPEELRERWGEIVR